MLPPLCSHFAGRIRLQLAQLSSSFVASTSVNRSFISFIHSSIIHLFISKPLKTIYQSWPWRFQMRIVKVASLCACFHRACRFSHHRVSGPHLTTMVYKGIPDEINNFRSSIMAHTMAFMSVFLRSWIKTVKLHYSWRFFFKFYMLLVRVLFVPFARSYCY